MPMAGGKSAVELEQGNGKRCAPPRVGGYEAEGDFPGQTTGQTNFQPLRYSRRMSGAASGQLVARRLAASQIIFLPTR